MKDSHSGDCQWLHKQIEKYPLIKYPFDLERLPDDGIYFFMKKGRFGDMVAPSPGLSG